MSLSGDVPVPGLYKLRLAKPTRWAAVAIIDVSERCPETGELLEDQRWEAERDGVPVSWEEVWPRCGGRPIDAVEYAALLASRPIVEGWITGCFLQTQAATGGDLIAKSETGN